MNFSTSSAFLFALIGLSACSGGDKAASPGSHPSDAGKTPLTDAGPTPDASLGDAGSSDIRMTQIHVKDFVFDARVAGPESGEVVFLLHGFPETGYEWRHQLSSLAKAGYRAIAPDQRGYSPGARPPNVADYGVLLLAQDVIGMADALGVDRFHLVGHDWGGGLGWALAKLYATRVITYTAVSTPHPDALKEKLSDATSCQHTDSAYFDTFTSPSATELLLGNDAAVLEGAYATAYPGETAEDTAVYLMALDNQPAMDAALNWYRANIKDRNFTTPALGDVTIPTRLVFGDADAYFCLDTAQATSTFVTGPYQFIDLPGVSHWVPGEAPDAVTQAILDVIHAASSTDGGGR